MSSATDVGRRVDVVAYLKLFRFPLVFTAIADSVTGRLLVNPDLGAGGSSLVFLALASAGLYFFGMSLNDIADRKRDQVIAPGRMIPSGRLSLGAALAACLGSLAASLVSLLLIRKDGLLIPMASWAFVVFCICAYNLFLKIPPMMGLVRSGNIVMGVLWTLDKGGASVYWHAVLATGVPAFVYVTALTYVSTLEDGAVHRGKLWVGAGFMVVGAGLTAFVYPLADALRWDSGSSAAAAFGRLAMQLYEDQQYRSVPFTVLLGGWVIWRAWKAVDKKGIMLLVRDGVGGIILLNASLLASFAIVPACFVASLILPAILSVAIFKKLA